MMCSKHAPVVLILTVSDNNLQQQSLPLPAHQHKISRCYTITTSLSFSKKMIDFKTQEDP